MCISIFSFISAFFLNNEFYSQLILGKRMYVAVLMRTAFMICVPLFMMLTGFLMNHKKLTKSYFKGIRKVLILYILSTVSILLFRAFYLNEELSFVQMLRSIFSFDHYSWYIEMYIGLYLLIPFINIMYNELPGEKEKRILVIVLLTMTSLPSLANTFDLQVLPTWWTSIYPLTYYFFGAYLSEFKDDIKLSVRMNFVLIVVAIIFNGTYCYWKSYGGTFVWGDWCAWGGFTNVIDAFLVFLFLSRVDIHNTPVIVKKILIKVSELSLIIYLVSWIFDNYAYPILNSKITYMPYRIEFYFIVVPFVFCCSFGLAYVIDIVYKYLCSKDVRTN